MNEVNLIWGNIRSREFGRLGFRTEFRIFRFCIGGQKHFRCGHIFVIGIGIIQMVCFTWKIHRISVLKIQPILIVTNKIRLL